MIDSKLKEHYDNEVKKALQDKFEFSSSMQVPKIEKVVINMGLGKAVNEKSMIPDAVAEMELIVGQKAVPTYARKSIASFKTREGMPIGVMVTLRGQKMYDFLEKLINISLPRVRDFRGLNPNAFDGSGNYSIGVKEILIFPEIEFDKIKHVKGLSISIVTSTQNDQEAKELLKMLKFPFKKENN